MHSGTNVKHKHLAVKIKKKCVLGCGITVSLEIKIKNM